jgi:hypothetical protein
MRPSCAVLLGVLSLAAPAAVNAQSGEDAEPGAARQGAFPEALFDLTFRKYTGPANVFSPFYSWDGTMALDVTAFRFGPGSFNADMVFQTIGTENLGGTSRVGVGATGYILGINYAHAYSDDFRLSGGIVHLSSHLTRDLTEKELEQRGKGEPIPTAPDPSQYNVLFLGVYRRFPTWVLMPAFEIVWSPVNFRFSGGRLDDVRPVYLGTRWAVWQRGQMAVVFTTQHEFGTNPFNLFALRLDLSPGNQGEGRFQILLEASPGDSFHVSPHVGAYRDGVALGFRTRFRA